MPGAGPLLLHGFTGSAASWGPVMGGLREKGFAPCAMDLPGHGARAAVTGPGAYELSRVLDDIDAASRWPGDLVGYSMGGRIALHYAVSRPASVRRLVLESGSPGLATDEERRARGRADRQLAGRIRTDGVRAFVEEWEALPLFATRADLAETVRWRHRALRFANHEEGLAGALEGLGTGALPSLWDRLAEVRADTLLLVGERDAKFRDIADRMAARLSHARIVVVRRAGHTVHLERPGAWVEAVVGFLDG